MTDSQVKYQTLMETQRHNLVMERLGLEENKIKQSEADTKWYQAETGRMQAGISSREADLHEREVIVDEFLATSQNAKNVMNAWESGMKGVNNVVSALSIGLRLFGL